MTRDARWWEVQRRCAVNPRLVDVLHAYLLGLRSFEDTALDALEESLDDLAVVKDGDSEEVQDPVRPDVEQSLVRYANGEGAETILLDLFETVLGATAIAAAPQARLRAQCAGLQQRITRRQRMLLGEELLLQQDVAELEKLQQELAVPPPATLPCEGGSASSSTDAAGGAGCD